MKIFQMSSRTRYLILVWESWDTVTAVVWESDCSNMGFIMMMQKPVIATDIRGSREEVDPNVTGLLVPVKNSSKLAAAVSRIYSNRDWADQLGLAGRKKALKHYDESKVISAQIEKISELFKEESWLKFCPLRPSE